MLSHKLFDKKAEQEYYNMSTDIFVVDTQWLIERLEEEAQKEHPEKLRYVLRDLAAESGAFAYEYTGYLANIHSVETYSKPILICLICINSTLYSLQIKRFTQR